MKDSLNCSPRWALLTLGVGLVLLPLSAQIGSGLSVQRGAGLPDLAGDRSGSFTVSENPLNSFQPETARVTWTSLAATPEPVGVALATALLVLGLCVRYSLPTTPELARVPLRRNRSR